MLGGLQTHTGVGCHSGLLGIWGQQDMQCISHPQKPLNSGAKRSLVQSAGRRLVWAKQLHPLAHQQPSPYWAARGV